MVSMNLVACSGVRFAGGQRVQFVWPDDRVGELPLQCVLEDPGWRSPAGRQRVHLVWPDDRVGERPVQSVRGDSVHES